MGNPEPYFTVDELENFREINDGMTSQELANAREDFRRQFVLTEEDLISVANDPKEIPSTF